MLGKQPLRNISPILKHQPKTSHAYQINLSPFNEILTPRPKFETSFVYFNPLSSGNLRIVRWNYCARLGAGDEQGAEWCSFGFVREGSWMEWDWESMRCCLLIIIIFLVLWTCLTCEKLFGLGVVTNLVNRCLGWLWECVGGVLVMRWECYLLLLKARRGELK